MMNVQETTPDMLKEQGFTLVEVMVSIVVAMTILAGLMLTFVNQSNEYQYQNKRIDTSQDLEFGIKFMEEDLRGALVGGATVDIYTAAGADPYTYKFTFTTWDIYCASCPAATPTNKGRVIREYTYNTVDKSLQYDRVQGGAPSEILPRVTFFKVFDDYTTALPAQRSAIYTDMPSALPQINVPGPATPILTSGYTILIEMAVDVGFRGASPVDVRGNTVTDKRIWRYVQVYPMTAVP